MKNITLDLLLGNYIDTLAGSNLSVNTASAYLTDIKQFIAYLSATDTTAIYPQNVTRRHVTEYLSYLADLGRTGVTRGRKLAAIREFFKYLIAEKIITQSPAQTVTMPKKEKRTRVFLRVDEYTKMLSVAGRDPRDFAILQIFLQTGIRVSEMANLRVSDIGLEERVLRVTEGKGKKEREIPLEKNGIAAIKSYLKVRSDTTDTHMFLNYEGSGLSTRGIKKVVEKYKRLAGITKKDSCHSLRHTFATYKAMQGVNAFQLQEWLGHEDIGTSQIYVHLGNINAHALMERTALR
jgi:integrase/recombinase XerC